MRSCVEIIGSARAALVVPALFALACPAPDSGFPLAVTFAGRVELEPGAEVRYQEVPVGQVTGMSLRQAEPDQPALVELALRIDDPNVTLRRKDVFEIVSDAALGESYVRVTAAPGTSEPLEAGQTVSGLPPFVTRVRESTSEVLDSLADLAKHKSDALLDALERSASSQSEQGEAAEEETPP